jgi:hypothetical protein
VCKRERLNELDPTPGDLSLYRTRQLVPSQRMEELRRCEVMIANWHRLAKRESNSVNGDTARVVKTGEAMEVVRQQCLAPFRFSIPPASRIAYATVFTKDLSEKAEIQATWAGHFPITQPDVIEKMFMASIQQLNGETQAAGET